jgi:hypothetical protein
MAPYTVASSYAALFLGTTKAHYAKELLKSRASLKGFFFHMAGHEEEMLDRRSLK